MSDEKTGVDAGPGYFASLRLESGHVTRVSVANGTALFDVRDDDGRLRPAFLTRDELTEIASMLHAAERNYDR